MAAASWVFVGDVGGPQTYHVGDEGMMDANLDLFRRILPGLEATVISADPEWSAAEYGVKAVPRLDLSRARDGDDVDALLDTLLAGGAAQTGPALDAIARADGLVISGGGNLANAWPAHIVERAVLVRAARRRNLPVIVLGQTIGPDLSANQRDLVSRLLRDACWVGVREAASYALAHELGVAIERLSYQLDDAIHLPPERPSDAWATELVRDEAKPWLAVTIHPVEDPGSDGHLTRALAAEIRKIAQATQARLVFLPHAAQPRDGGWSDHAMGRALMRHLEPGCMTLVEDRISARHARWLAGQAEFVVSTRYHPVVFGLAAGVPCLGIWTDDYTRVKLEGALSHAGRIADTCYIWQAATAQIAEKALVLWDQRAQIRIELARRVATWRERESRRADALAEVVRHRIGPAGKGTMIDDDKNMLIGHLAEAVRGAARARDRAVDEIARYARSQEARAAALDRSLAETTRYAESLERSRDEALRHARLSDEQAGVDQPRGRKG